MRYFSIPSSTRTTMDRKFYQDPRYQDPRYQDPRYQDPRYQSDPQYQNPSNPPPQSEQFTGAPHQHTTYDAHPNYQDQHAYQTHSEGSQRSHAPGHHSGYLDTSHADGRMAFPEPRPQRSPSGRPAPALASSQPTHDPNPGFQYQQTAQYPYPSSSGPSGGRQVYTTGGPATSATTQYAQPTVPQSDLGGGSIVASAQPQDWNNQEYEPREKGPPIPLVGVGQTASALICRYRGCNRPVFRDMRVGGEVREWCSDSHMRAAITQRMEKPCKHCQIWPRRNGFRYCSGNTCRYPQ